MMQSKQHPILFSTAMVQAILAGRKSQTRRIVKDSVPIGNWDITVKHCPYGQPEDILWVRETWATHPPYNDERPSIICGDDQPFTIHKNSGFKTPVIHKAGKENNAWGMFGEPKWKPSIHMPKSACRLYLQITDIRVERLNELSEEDAKAEGVELNRDDSWHDYLEPNRLYQDSAKASFQSLWLKINGPDSWDSNPFVWVISFKKID